MNQPKKTDLITLEVSYPGGEHKSSSIHVHVKFINLELWKEVYPSVVHPLHLIGAPHTEYDKQHLPTLENCEYGWQEYVIDCRSTRAIIEDLLDSESTSDTDVRCEIIRLLSCLDLLWD